MDCDRYLELMSAALDGELSAGERRELDSHLAVCPECAALFEQLSGQSAALRELDCQLPAGLRERILAGLPPQEAPVKKGKVIHWKRWASLAACLVLVTVVGVLGPWNMRMGSAAPNSAAPNLAAVPDSYVGSDSSDQYRAGEPAEPNWEGLPACPFTNDRYIRVTWGSTPAAPAALILGSTVELADYLALFPDDDLSDLSEAYGDGFFAEGRLLAVVAEAGSGSVRFELDPNGLTPDSVTLLVDTPEVGTCDMAAWLILVEVDSSFDGGTALEVLFSE